MEFEPLVSVVLAVHNGERTLSTAIDSIMKQSFENWRLFIVDDGSTDATGLILDQYANDTEKIVLIRLSEQRGLAYCLNLAISRSESEFIARMDADDYSHESRLASQVKFFKSHPDIDVLGSAAWVVNPSGSDRRLVVKKQFHSDIENAIRKENPFFHSAVMFRRSFVRDTGGYDIKYRKAQDYDLWLRGVGKSKYHNLLEPLLTYTARPQSVRAIAWGFEARRRNARKNLYFVMDFLTAVSVLVYGIARSILASLMLVFKS